MWPNGSFYICPSGINIEASFPCSVATAVLAQSLIFLKLLNVFDLFQHILRAEMGLEASPTDIQDEHPDITRSCAL